MMRKKNRGVTLVEVLIALAIFLILMVPLVSSLVTSIKTTDSAKELQERNEYAQFLMENIKNAPIDDLKSSKLYDYFKGSTDIVLGVYPGGSDFDISGSTFIGPKNKKYSYVIECRNKKKTATYGIMEQLDNNKVAIIPVTLSNYDDAAIESIVMQQMKTTVSSRLDDTSNGTIFNQDTTKTDANTVSSYRNSAASRELVIKVESDLSTSGGYNVSCSLKYEDVASHKVITYEPYRKHFDKAPDLYLMYNNGIYNDLITTDTIKYDLSGLNVSDLGSKERINAFIIRTAEDYSKITSTVDGDGNVVKNTAIINALDSAYSNLGTKLSNMDDDSSSTLYRKTGDASFTRNANDITVDFVPCSDADIYKHFRVYHNIVDTGGSIANNTFTSQMDGTHKVVDVLANAHEETWNLYSVKIWMQEGEIANVNRDAKLITLQGTRGGGEIE